MERNLLIILAAVVGLAFAIILHGIVIQDIWGWFICRPFGLPELSLRTAIGISLMSVLLRNPLIKTRDEKFIGENYIITIAGSLMLWATAWVVHFNMAAL